MSLYSAVTLFINEMCLKLRLDVESIGDWIASFDWIYWCLWAWNEKPILPYFDFRFQDWPDFVRGFSRCLPKTPVCYPNAFQGVRDTETGAWPVDMVLEDPVRKTRERVSPELVKLGVAQFIVWVSFLKQPLLIWTRINRFTPGSSTFPFLSVKRSWKYSRLWCTAVLKMSFSPLAKWSKVYWIRTRNQAYFKSMARS